MIYDPTAHDIETPAGIGKFIEYDGNTKTVLAEMDNMYLVYFPAEECFIKEV